MLPYDAWNYASALVLVVYNYLHFREKRNLLSGTARRLQAYFREKEWPAWIVAVLSGSTLWVLVEILVLCAAQFLALPVLGGPFGDLVNTGANYFAQVYFGPLLLTAVCVLLRLDPLRQADLVTPAYPLCLVFAKIGCFTAGCCHGMEWDGGIYNHYTQRLEVPIQLIEAAVAALIFLFLLVWRRRAKRGMMLPAYLIVYSATRFFTEFLRGEPEVFWIFKTYHILCVVGVLVGIGWGILVTRFRDRISSYYMRE